MKIIESRGDGLFGIWWYTPSKDVIGVTKSIDDGVSDGDYIQYNDKENHLTLWRKVIKENYKEPIASKIISKGYKSFERGRVIYNLRTQCYEVTCSKNLVNDLEFRKKIIDYFNLDNDRKDFVSLGHYYVAELTGNKFIDDLEYGL